jgi:hypothetical protein
MKLNLVKEKNQIVITTIYNNKRTKYYTNISAELKGGELIITSVSENLIKFTITPFYSIEETEVGFNYKFDIKLTNWLSFFVKKAVRAAKKGEKTLMFKLPSDFNRKLKVTTEVKL